MLKVNSIRIPSLQLIQFCKHKQLQLQPKITKPNILPPIKQDPPISRYSSIICTLIQELQYLLIQEVCKELDFSSRLNLIWQDHNFKSLDLSFLKVLLMDNCVSLILIGRTMGSFVPTLQVSSQVQQPHSLKLVVLISHLAT